LLFLIVRFRGPKIFATFDEDKRAKDYGQRLGEEDALMLPLCASSSLPAQTEEALSVEEAELNPHANLRKSCIKAMNVSSPLCM